MSRWRPSSVFTPVGAQIGLVAFAAEQKRDGFENGKRVREYITWADTYTGFSDEGRPKHTKRKKRDHFSPLCGNEISAAGCLRLLPKHGRCESVNASQLVAANKLLLCDKMFAGLMGLECHTKPRTHRSEGKHGSHFFHCFYWPVMSIHLLLDTRGLIIHIYFFISITISVVACFWNILPESGKLKWKRCSREYIKPTSCVCTARPVGSVCGSARHAPPLQHRALYKGGIKSKHELSVNLGTSWIYFWPCLVCSLWDFC